MGVIHHKEGEARGTARRQSGAPVSGRRNGGPAQALIDDAVRVFGSQRTAKEWLNEPIPSLAGRKPIDMIRGSKSEQRRVRDVLGRIEYGIF